MKYKLILPLIVLTSLILTPNANSQYVPPKYWPVIKAEFKLEHRPVHHHLVAGRLVLRAECKGMGKRYRRENVRFYNKFSCTVYHPNNFLSFAYLKARNMFDYNLEVIGGIGRWTISISALQKYSSMVQFQPRTL